MLVFIYDKIILQMELLELQNPVFIYLKENISFEPNSSNDFMPTGPQIASGQYPVGTAGAYHLGFFAAITVETTGVILDLKWKNNSTNRIACIATTVLCKY